MISIIHWISAKRRLTEVQKTIIMLGGEHDASEVPVQILAQREMIEREVNYYETSALTWICIMGALVIIAVPTFVLMHKSGVL